MSLKTSTTDSKGFSIEAIRMNPDPMPISHLILENKSAALKSTGSIEERVDCT